MSVYNYDEINEMKAYFRSVFEEIANRVGKLEVMQNTRNTIIQSMAISMAASLGWLKEVYTLLEQIMIGVIYRKQENIYLHNQLSNVLDQLSQMPEVSAQVLSIKEELESIEWVKDKKVVFETLDNIIEQMTEEPKEPTEQKNQYV